MNKELCECIFYGECTHILMSMVHVHRCKCNYSGIRLTTTSLSTADKCATSVKPEVNWESVDIKFYELHKVDSEKVMHNMLPRNFKYINRCL